VVTDKEFQRIVDSDDRYSYVNQDNLGFADPDKGVAYVRRTAHGDLDKYLVNHEFEHLLNPEDKADRDSNGIYHKKIFKEAILPAIGLVAPPAVPFLPKESAKITRKWMPKEIPDAAQFVGSAVGYGLGGPVGAAAGGGLGGAYKEIYEQPDPNASLGKRILGSGAKGAALGFGLGSGAQFLGAPQFGTASSATGFTGNVANQTVRPSSIQSVAGQQSAPGPLSRMMGGPSGFFQGMGRKLKSLNPFQGGPPTPPPGSSAVAGASQQAAEAVTSGQAASQASGFSPFKFGAGAALATLPGLLTPTPKAPDLSSLESVQRIKNQNGQPLTESAKLATSRLNERLGAGFEGLPKDVESGIRRTFDQQRQDVSSQFRMFRPNADVATDSGFRRAMMDIDQRESESLANTQLQERGRFENRQGTDIAQALGIDQQTMEQFTELAKLDVATIMTQLGIDSQAASDFKRTFGQLGSILASSAMGTPTVFSPFQVAA